MLRFAAVLLAAFSLAACETRLDEPVEMSPATRGALDVLPADARSIAMADLQAMKRHGFGLFAGESLGRMGGAAGARLRDFFQATGLHPEDDFRSAYVAITEAGAPALALYADFSEERLEAYLREEAGDAFAPSSYGGVVVYEHASAGGDGSPAALALVNGDLILASPEAAQVRAMIDRLSGRGAALSTNAEAMRLIEQVQGRGDAWLVARGGAARFLSASAPARARGNADPAARLMRAVRDAAATVRFGDEGLSGLVLLTAEDGIDPDDLAAVARGLVASQKASATGDAQKLRALDQVRVETRGEQVRVDFAFDR